MRSIVTLGAMALLLVLSVSPAEAHAVLASSDPADGQRLAAAPAVVSLRFTEPLNSRLSRATVTDPNGQQFQGSASAAEELRVRLLTNAPGVYRVAWATVSVVDGHTLHGGLVFGVGVAAGGQTEGDADAGPRLRDVLIAMGRAVEDAALLVATGMLLLVGLARLDPRLPEVRPPVRVVLAVALAAGLTVVLAETVAASAVHGVSVRGMVAFLTSGLAGWARLCRVALEAVALPLSWAARPARGTLRAWPVVGLAVVALAASGHAAGAAPAWWGIMADAAHLLAAGLWAGGIVALATVRLQQGWRWTEPRGGALLARFSPVALAAFAVSAGFGVVQAFQQVGTVQALLTSSYGRVLGLKVVAVAAMLPLSLRAWRRHPVLRLETALGMTAVALAALLAAYPLPPARLAQAEADAARPAPNPAIPRQGDLTMASHVGPVLLGLTIRPGSPGRNDLLVYLLPPDGEFAAATIPVTVTVDGHPVQVEQCGPSCRRGTTNLAPGARVEIGLASPRAGVVAFRLPLLPAPDGGALLHRVQGRMHHLSTLHYTEVLSSGLDAGSLRSSYQQQAPDRLRVQTSSGSRTVWVGTTMYLERHPGEGWTALPDRASYTVPSFVWDYLATQFLDPRIVGAARVDGVATKILSFFGPSSSAPIWFRLWVDPDGLVRRAEMRAAGHFMDQRYDHFNANVDIVPPS
jgi:copper transport protein